MFFHLLERFTHVLFYISIQIDKIYQKFIATVYGNSNSNISEKEINFLLSLRTNDEIIPFTRLCGILPNHFTYQNDVYEYRDSILYKNNKKAPFNSILRTQI